MHEFTNQPSPIMLYSSTMIALQTTSLHRTLSSLQTFIAWQKQWLAKIERSFQSGHDIETITLCMNQLHAVLRKGLWIMGQLHSLKAKKGLFNDEELLRLLANPAGMMPRGVDLRELYGAAERFGFLRPDKDEELSRMHEEVRVILRRMFHPQEKRDADRDLELLHRLAGEFLKAVQECVSQMEKRAQELEEAMRMVKAV